MTEQTSAALAAFHPAVRAWFAEHFSRPTQAQLHGWPAIAGGSHTLIAAPTGSGKTLAAFLWCIDHLLQLAVRGELRETVHILYVSPLKALNNDIQKNLAQPLGGIQESARRLGYAVPDLRSAVRTGDTPATDRALMTRRPPHILITTPESLFILLTGERFRQALSTVRYVIVDEIHAVAGNKRGVHLTLSLERLAALADAEPVRTGLSATQHPIEEIARFLVGYGSDGARRPCRIVDVGRRRDHDLEVIAPATDLGAVATNAVWDATYERLAALIREHRTTLVFANSRRLVERIAVRLTERLGEGMVGAHHGSLSRKRRLEAETRLKAGELRALVATGSLELGIDIGAVDLVCQIESPRAVATAVQRIGRSGHSAGAAGPTGAPGAIPKGRLFALTRDDVLECAAVVRAIREGLLDQVEIPKNCLDVLAQQVVAAAVEEWDADALFARCRRSACFHDLPRPDFDATLAMLADRLPTEPKGVYPKLHWDRVRGRVRGRRGARLAAITSGGTIPDTTNYDVFLEPDGVKLGEVEEDFAQESMRGDIFTLGNASWRILGVQRGRMVVESAQGLPPTVPFWHGEVPGRTFDLSREVSRLRRDIADRLSDPEGGRRWLAQTAGLDPVAAAVAVDYVAKQQAALGLVPTGTALAAERFFDNLGGTQIVLHAPFGMRVNRAWGLALSKTLCRTFNFEIQSAANDDAILLSLGPRHSFPLETIFHLLAPETLEAVLTQAVLAAPLFEARFRQVAARALMVLRHGQGRRVPAYLQRLRATDLLAACFPEQQACLDNRTGDIEVIDHPLIKETLRECLLEALDLPRLREILTGLRRHEIGATVREVVVPSPFAHEILAAWDYAYLDGAPREERRSRTVQVHRGILGEALRGDAADHLLDPEVVGQVAAEVSRTDPRRPLRDADEVVEFLKDAGPLTEAELHRRTAGDPGPILALLREQGRAAPALLAPDASACFWIATEILPLCRAAYPALHLPDPPALPAAIARQTWDPEQARSELVRRLLRHSGPITAEAVARGLALPEADARQALAALEAEGVIFRGTFVAGPGPQWCERTILERIHQRTLRRLREEIEPVPAPVFVDFLFHWQHVAPCARLPGIDGLEQVIGQLQGLDLPAAAWEGDILPVRVADYRPELLDRLCLSGVAGWARLVPPSGHSRTEHASAAPPPIGLFLREDLGWLRGDLPPEEIDGALRAASPPAAAVHRALSAGGASFPDELGRAAGLGPAATHAALWELARAGLVTNDSFAPVRLLSSAEGRQGLRAAEADLRPSRKALRFRVQMRILQGRWCVLGAGEGGAAGGDRTTTWARQLLDRYGVVFRELLELETGAPPWRELVEVYRRMEVRAEARRGRFVAGVSGEQYALPGAVELLRARRRAGAAEQPTVLSGADPANVYGPVLADPKIPRRTGVLVVFQAGHPVLILDGGHLWSPRALDEERLAAGVGALLDARRDRPLVVESWNGQPALTSAAAALLAGAGFHTDGQRLTYDGLPGPRLRPGPTARLSTVAVS